MTATEPRPYLDRFEFEGNDNDGKPRTAYIDRIAAMTDEELLKETENKIWLSAYAANNRRSDYHWHATGCYEEWTFRGKADQYTVAWKAASGQD